MTSSRIHQSGLNNHHHAIFGMPFITESSFSVSLRLTPNPLALQLRIGVKANSLYKSDYCSGTDV